MGRPVERIAPLRRRVRRLAFGPAARSAERSIWSPLRAYRAMSRWVSTR